MKKEIFSGISLGILTGFIIGLSISQIAGIILGALTSLLAAFFGLKSGDEGKTANLVIIGSFSIACLVSIFMGLYMRTHNFLSPSLADQIKIYKSVPFDSIEIKKIILLKEFGLVPDGYSVSNEAKYTNDKTSLMAGEGSVLCEEINDSSSLEQIKEKFRESGFKFQEMERRLSEVIADENALKQTLLYLKSLACRKEK